MHEPDLATIADVVGTEPRSRGLALHEEGRHGEALEAMRTAAAGAVDLDLLNDLAVIAAAAGETEVARSVLRGVSAIDSSHRDARQNLQALGGSPLDVDSLRAGSLGPALSPKLLGHLFATPPPADPSLAARIDQLPSATAPGERWLYFNVAAHLWSGRADLLENGPLLGGTTRAACLGMLANPRRSAGARLHTYDWFRTQPGRDGVDSDLAALVPADQLDGLVRRGLLSPPTLERMHAERDFEPVFRELHAGHDYSPLLGVHRASLPDLPDDVEGAADLFSLPAGSDVEIAFVDGCKSWFGTRWFLDALAGANRPGSLVVLQDFGWHTCFWISSVIGLMLDRVRLIAYNGTTYVFEFPDGLTPDDVARIPASPEELGGAGFDELYSQLLEWAWELDDSWLLLALTLQHAGALAYLGYREEARRSITAVMERREYGATHAPAATHRPMALKLIRDARRTPTYHPRTGEVRL